MSTPSFSPAHAIRPSRVLICTDAVTGSWHYSIGLATALRAHRIEVCMAITGPGPTAAQRAEAASLGNVELHDHPFALEWMPQPWDDIARAGEWLLALEEQFAPDVIQLNHYAYTSLPWSAPVILTAHGDQLSRARATGESLLPDDEERYYSELLSALRAADQVIAPTRAVLNDLCQLQQSGSQLPHVDLFRCAPRVIPHACSRSRHLSRPKREYILAAGRAADTGKNLRLLDQAAHDLPWPVFLAGSIEDPSGVPVEFSSIDCLGPLASHDLANWMGWASIFVHPARYEPSGIAAMEAALCGCALVLGDLPHLREQWCNAALFVDPERPLELGNALQKLIRSPDLRHRLARLAHKRAIQHTPEIMATSHLECYQSALTRRHGDAFHTSSRE